MKKKKVRLGLKDKTILEKCELAYTISTHCTGNANFVTPNPKLAVVVAAADAARAAFDAAQGGGHQLKQTMHQRETDLDNLLVAFADYIDNIAQGNELIILSAGVDTSKDPEPSGPTDQVTGLVATPTKKEGEVMLRFKKVKKAIVYAVYGGQTADGPYTQIKIISATKFLVTDLQSLLKHWFRIQAIGRGGKEGPFSDPAFGVAM